MSQPPASESQSLDPPLVTSFVTSIDVRELSGLPDTLAIVAALRERGLPWLLDSAMEVERLGRFSFVGADPYLVVRARGREAQLECRRDVRPDLTAGTTRCVADPFDLVRSLLAPLQLSGLQPFSGPQALSELPDVPFIGGALGYFGYELAACIESIELTARDDLQLPDLALLFVDRLIAVDHEQRRAWAIGLGFARDAREASANASRASADLHAVAERSAPATPRGGTPPRLLAPEPAGFEAFFDAESYGEAVDVIREEIVAGNVYQANLTQRMDLCTPDLDVLALYRELRELNPAPFAAFFELPEVAILSSSPERFLRLAGQEVESRPIKGTRPRGTRSAAQDGRLREELLGSAKDRAENLMIVDLVRNDLGRVCELASIEVPELMSAESYATVHHMVSTITGRLRSDCDVLDLVRASFPPGSMTGAPKLAAMQIIDRLEPVRRGIYSGALGYLDVRGGCDLSVVIRTLIVVGNRAHLHVGGGIVADSEPEAEYRETLDKAQALLAALASVARARTPEPMADPIASSSG